MSTPPLDILALAAHRDDVEQTCGGTLLKMAQLGHRTGILDLTQGEMGTRGGRGDRSPRAARPATAAWPGAAATWPPLPGRRRCRTPCSSLPPVSPIPP